MLQKINSNTAYDLLTNKYKEDFQFTPYCLDYYAFPKVYGTTSGPFGGIGGCTMTTFTVECWVVYNYAVVFCGDKVLSITDKWKGIYEYR